MATLILLSVKRWYGGEVQGNRTWAAKRESCSEKIADGGQVGEEPHGSLYNSKVVNLVSEESNQAQN